MRRDNCLLVRNVVTTSLEMILMEKDVDGAQSYVRNTIADLLMNRMDLSLLVITKAAPPSPHHACACLLLRAAPMCRCHSRARPNIPVFQMQVAFSCCRSPLFPMLRMLYQGPEHISL